MNRTTIAQRVTLSGRGLFSDAPSSMSITPSTRAMGILFEHKDKTIPAEIGSLCDRPVHPVFARLKPRCTSVGDDAVSIATIEHLMSALIGTGISDVRIEIDAQSPHAEIPILDGSAQPFVDAITQAGVMSFDSPVEPIRVVERIVVEDGDSIIVIEPSETPSYSYLLDYPGTVLGRVEVSWDARSGSYAQQIAPARTFSLEHEALQMQSAGLFTHLSPRDMLVIGEDGPIENEYRLEHECARHKLLDLIGDLALVGSPLIADVRAKRSGHSLAHRATQAIVDQRRNQ